MRPSLVSTQRPTPCPPAETQQELLGDSPSTSQSSPPRGRSRASSIVAACAFAAVALGASSEALAQDQLWLKDRRYTEGAGIRVGDFELHPGIAAEFGYDSNYLRRADQDGTVGTLRLRITPSLSLSTLGPQRSASVTPGAPAPPRPDVDFRTTLALTYNEFFPVSGEEKTQGALANARNLAGNLDLNLNLFPGREWSGSLYAGVGRAVQPSESAGIQAFEGVFDRFLTRAGAELAWTPGAGLLDWRLGYRFSGTIFQEPSVSGLTNIDNTIQTRGRWRFLPRTALLYDARFGFINYVNPGSGGAEVTTKTSSHPVRVQLGVNGLVTPSFGVLAMVGYGASFYDATPRSAAHDFDSVIGQAEVKWYLTPNPSSDPGAATLSISSLSIGFIRDFQDSYLGTYLERDRGYANLSYFFGGRFLVVVDGGAGPIVYPKLDSVNGNPLAAPDNQAWTDIRYDASVLGEYRIKDYFGINATVRYQGNASSKTLPVPTSNGTPGRDSLQWQAFEAYLGARFLM